MTIEDETKAMYKTLSKTHQQLVKANADYFELKSLELELLRLEGQLRSLDVEF